MAAVLKTYHSARIGKKIQGNTVQIVRIHLFAQYTKKFRRFETSGVFRLGRALFERLAKILEQFVLGATTR